MSGVEFIIGTTLASIPLALEAYDRSGRAIQVYKTLKRFPRELRLLEESLSSQKAIFRNNTVNLLIALTNDKERVKEVVRDPSSAAAGGGLTLAPCFSFRLHSLLESFEACVHFIKSMTETLDGIREQFDAFRRDVGTKDEAMTSSQWLRHVKSRISLALNKPKIEKLICHLRDQNTDYDIIARQIRAFLRDLTESARDNNATPVQRPIKSLNVLNQYHRVRKASSALHSGLCVKWACSTQAVHKFDIKLVDVGSAPNGERRYITKKGPRITYEIAIGHGGSSHAVEDPLRLQIEQICEAEGENEDRSISEIIFQSVPGTSEHGRMEPALDTLMQALELQAGKSRTGNQYKDSQSTETTSSARTPSKLGVPTCVRFQDSNCMAPHLPTTVLDLDLVNDLCHRFQDATNSCAQRALLGCWRTPQSWWFTIPPTPLAAPRSISDIILWISKEPVLRSLPRISRIDLAIDIAEGLMNFYSTPWLCENDLGHTIQYMCQLLDPCTDTSPETASTMTYQGWDGPFFTMDPTTKDEKGKEPERNEYFIGDTYARNNLLFRYGILLLELGFGKPWHQLKQTALTGFGPAATSDQYTAERLAKQLVQDMGPTYPKVIRKCLACDFGLGETDLDNEDLQRKFVEDVVEILKQLQKSMRQYESAL